MPQRKKKSFLLEILDEQDYFEADLDKIRTVCEKILDDAAIRSGKLSVILVDNDTSHQYNKDFLKHDYPTDVISFPIEDRRDEGYLEGEILVCTQVAMDRAPEFGWSPEEELMLYVVHGTLHLVGFDDTSTEVQTVMREKEKEYLAHIGISVPKWNLDDWGNEPESN